MNKKTILLTGATGFLGSHLIKEFLKQEHQIIILKRSFSDTRRIDDLLHNLKSYDLDQCSLEQVFIENKNIDAIIHTATCYGKNKERVSQILEANTLFPLKLLELAINYKVKSFLNTDTYFNKGKIPYQGLPFYSLSKYQFMNWGKELATVNHKIRFINIYLEHPFGEDDNSSKFTSYIIKSCLDNAKKLDLTQGEQKRDFIYIDDIISAYTLLLSKSLEKETFYQEYQLGRGEVVTIKEFVETIHELSGCTTQLNFGVLPYTDSEIMYSQANINPLKQMGWQPKYTLKEGLRKVINSFRN